MYGNGSIQCSNIRTYGIVLKSAEKNHLRSSNIIFFTNNTVGRQIYENGSTQHWNIRTYKLALKSDKSTHLWYSWTISLTINTVGRWMYENGSIQCSNIKTYGLLFKSAKKLICDLDAQYPLPIILLGVECSKMVVFNTLTSGPMDSCLNPLNNSFVIFIHNIPYQ